MRALVLLLAIAMSAVTPVAAAAAEYTVVIARMKFGPLPAELRAGDTIIWQNDDILRHTATARDGSFDVDLPAGATVSMVVGDGGTVEIYCRFHPGMAGTLVIAE
jgi:plastocyanin